jgi:hydroxymethylpyrimidine/phosphomethylpyrimidine kinase
MSARPPRLLVVAGHDPSGAGIDADREALAGLPLEARFVVTARTEQDAGGVRALGARGAAEWLREALRELPAAALKFGLLPGSEHVHAAAELVRAARERHTSVLGWGAHASVWAVVDPVLSSSSGSRFLDAAGAREYLSALLPARIVLTPNLDELAELSGLARDDLAQHPETRSIAALALLDLGAEAIVVKGGHGEENPVRDLVLARESGPVWLEHARVRGGKVRGSGCRFATRLAAHLALGATLVDAAREASEHVLDRIRQPGKGP